MKSKPRTLKIGPLSENTDLVAKIVDAMVDLNRLTLSRPMRNRLETQRHRAKKWHSAGDNNDRATVEDIWLVIEDIVEDCLPPFCQLTEVDGFPTVLPDDNLIADAIAEGEIGNARHQAKQVPPWVLEVNDHGNRRLYQKRRSGHGHRWIEVWSVV